MKTITKEELKEKMEAGGVVLVEVLKPEKYKEEHIKGAVNIPTKEIVTEAKQKFDKDDMIVVYCSDFECTASPTAARKLTDAGFTNIYDFEGGKKEWKEAGYPMEKGDS